MLSQNLFDSRLEKLQFLHIHERANSSDGSRYGGPWGGSSYRSWFVEHGVNERLRVERREIVHPLTEPYVADRQTKLGTDCQGDTALRGTVELGQHHAGRLNHLTKYARLIQCVLSGGRIDDQQDF